MPTRPLRGVTGATGARGERGQRGLRGERGPAGPAVTRAQVLAAVHHEFEDLRKQLQIQLERMAQIQLQIDAIEKALKQLLANVENGV